MEAQLTRVGSTLEMSRGSRWMEYVKWKARQKAVGGKSLDAKLSMLDDPLSFSMCDSERPLEGGTVTLRTGVDAVGSR